MKHAVPPRSGDDEETVRTVFVNTLLFVAGALALWFLLGWILE